MLSSDLLNDTSRGSSSSQSHATDCSGQLQEVSISRAEVTANSLQDRLRPDRVAIEAQRSQGAACRIPQVWQQVLPTFLHDAVVIKLQRGELLELTGFQRAEDGLHPLLFEGVATEPQAAQRSVVLPLALEQPAVWA
eukprot:2466291-Prymnesium_polylepis.2